MFPLVPKSSLLIQHTFECFVSSKGFGPRHSKMTTSAPVNAQKVIWGTTNACINTVHPDASCDIEGCAKEQTANPGDFTEEVIFGPDLQDALQLGSWRRRKKNDDYRKRSCNVKKV